MEPGIVVIGDKPALLFCLSQSCHRIRKPAARKWRSAHRTEMRRSRALGASPVVWAARAALGAGKHTIVFDFKSDGPGLGKGGMGVLFVDGKEVHRKSMEHTTPITFAEDESFDIGQDTRTGVAMLEYRSI
jgi:hypothetical protein